VEGDFQVDGQRPNTSEARERVITAAYTLFVQRGYADVSMQQIADRASITKATLYYHFRDKQDLYLATMRMAFTRNQATLIDRIGPEPAMPFLIREVLAFVLETKRADIQRLMADFHQHVDKETQQRFWTEFPKPWLMLEPIVQRAIDHGEIGDADAAFVSKYIYGAIAGYAHIMRMHDSSEMDDTMLAHFADTVLRGISPR
jgi:AcrR family transcriptional regulator